MDKSTVQIELIIKDDELNRKNVTEKIGLQPDIGWEKGDSIIGSQRTKSFGMWGLVINQVETYSTTDMLDTLINRVNGKEKNFSKVKEIYPTANIVLEIIIRVEKGIVPGVVLERRHIEFLALSGAELDVAIYIFS